MQMQSFPTRYRISLLLLSILTFCTGRLHSQADPTASKNTQYSVFGAYSLVSPDDRNATLNSGVTFGGDYTHMFGNFALSVEPRFAFAPGNTVGERTFGGGFRFEYRIKRLIPYVDYIVSYGIVTFTHSTDPNYTRDDAYVRSPGLGVDYYFTRQWGVRADYQFQHWTIVPGDTFNPRVLSFGVVYRLPFKPYVHYWP
jgi:hypothetical protein